MSKITEPAAAIMNFVDTLIGARLSGFVDTSTPTLAQIYQCARNHVMDNYGVHTSLLSDIVSSEDLELLSKEHEPCKTPGAAARALHYGSEA